MTTKPMTDDEIRTAKERLDAATTIAPAPWEWYGNVKQHEVYLASVERGRIYAMSFTRWGMQGGQPRFQVRLDGKPGTGIMCDLREIGGDLGPQMVGSHRNDFIGIGHPVARFLAAAPETVGRLLATLRQLTNERDAARDALSYLANGVDGYDAAKEWAEDIAAGRRAANGAPTTEDPNA